jgi:hypothetical protein
MASGKRLTHTYDVFYNRVILVSRQLGIQSIGGHGAGEKSEDDMPVETKGLG